MEGGRLCPGTVRWEAEDAADGDDVPQDDVPSPIPPAFDQLPRASRGRARGDPGLLERLAEVPDPRDPRGVRHALVVVLALTAFAVLAGAPSLLALGEWINDAPPSVVERPGVRTDPLSPKRCLPAEATVRRLPGRIDGDTLNRAVGHWSAAPPAH
ncbi:transposase family protein [Streptomyces sp. NBC_00887]|uniref:transposase family protein n=1 Tax=Streptomyces sp. NBC_00887 TaxID=2975859 RepID=UPI00386EB974|nr:transposase family protein [Streptomyces sp. NBC_00887]